MGNKEKWKKLISMPKSLYFNFKVLPFKVAMKIPIYISYDVKLDKIRKGVIEFEGPVSRGLVQIGFHSIKGTITPRNGYIRFGAGDEAKILFCGSVRMAKGTYLCVDRGKLSFGDNFTSNDNLYISCNKKISFGNDVLIGWGVGIRDSDNHTISVNGISKKSVGEVHIGNHVWIASYADILKNTFVGNDSVIAYRALTSKNYQGDNQLIGGVPAKVISENISWENEAVY